MKVSVEDMQLFIRIVELGSLRQAALELRSEPSTITRRLAALEERVGVPLIERSRLQSKPTEAGEEYYRQLRPLLMQLEQLEADVTGKTLTPSGLLRISCPVDFGSLYVAPWMLELQQKYSGLEVELLLDDRFVNLTEQGIDIALRVGELTDSRLYARHLGDMPMCIVASPDYLGRHDAITNPEQLEQHAFIIYSWLRKPGQLTINKGQERVPIQMHSRFAVNNVGAIKQLVLQGGGLHVGPLWIMQSAIHSGELVSLFPDWTLPSFPLNALFKTRGASQSGKVRAALELMSKRIANVPGIAF